MKAMKWILGAVVAAAIGVPLQSANAWGGGPHSGGGYEESHRVHYRGGDYHGDRGNYRGYHGPHHRYGRYGHRGYYQGHRHYDGGPGYYGRPRYGYGGPVVVVPLPPLPPPFPW